MNKSKKSVSFSSARLTLYAVVFLTVVFAVLLFAAPALFRWYSELSNHGHNAFVVLTATFYICSPAAVTVIVFLIKFLRNVINGKIFVEENIHCLRYISIPCFVVVPLTIPLCCEYIAALAIPGAALLMALLLRVLTDAVATGTSLKNEVDLTV